MTAPPPTIEAMHALCSGCCLCAVDTPASAQAERLGLLPLNLIYRCRTCLRFVPWCIGAADDRPDDCDDCWARAHAQSEGAAA